MRPMAAEVISIQRFACSKCGAQTNAPCNCGEPLLPVAKRIDNFIKANPGQSNRTVADAVGTSEATVRRNKPVASCDATEDGSPNLIIGKSGRPYPASRPAKEESPKIGTANLRNVFLMNCAASQNATSYSGPIDDEIRAAARRTADAWKKLADEMENSR